MFTIHGLRLENIVYFKNAKIALNKKPLTFVRGLNLDSDPANPTSNGAGKSLLFSCIPNIFYFSPPSATRKNSKKELLKKGSANTVVFSTPSGVKYSVTQTAKGYVIKENGVDLQYKRIPDAEKFIRKIFPLHEIDYYTYCYVSTQRPYLLQSDTDSNRLDHLTAIFRLDSYDLMKSHFVKQLASVKSNEVKLSILEQKALEDRVKIKKIQAKQEGSASTDKKVLRTEQKSLGSDLERLNNSVFTVDKAVSTLTTLKRIEKELDTLRSQYTYKVKPSSMYPKLVAERKLLRTLEKFVDAMTAYHRAIKTLTGKIDAITLPKFTKKELNKRLSEVTANIESEQSNLDALEEIESKYKRQQRIVESLHSELSDLSIPKDIDLTTDWGNELAQCMSTLKLSSLLDHEHLDKKKNACPVCLSSIDLDNIKQAVGLAKKRLPKLKAFTKARNLTKQIADESTKVSAQDLTSLENELVVSRAFIEKATQSKAEYTQHLKTLEKHADLSEELADIDKPKKPKHLPSLEVTLEEIDAQIELCSDILKHLEAKDRLLENDPTLVSCRTVEAVAKELLKNKKKLKQLSVEVLAARKDLRIISEQIEQASLLDSELEITSNNLSKLELEIKELKPQVDDKAVLETLVKAYSTKGLKTLVAKEVCSLIETNLNFYRDLVFAEPFSFSVIASESGLSILVDRNNDVVSDVRNLSGAESNSFRLLFLLSLLVLIPSERRLNMITLDEPCSHMDDVSREIFLTRYLPALQEVVDNVYIVTPNTSDFVEGSSLLLVKKEDGKSTLHTSYTGL